MQQQIKNIIYTALFILSFNNIYAQCFDDRHSMVAEDAWLSCETSENPNPERGDSHWIMYDFGEIYVLDDLDLWNYNVLGASNNGVSEVIVEISENMETWTMIGTESVDIAPESSYYEGEAVLSIGNLPARYLLITATNNHGGDCYGLSELRVSIGGVSTPLSWLAFDAVNQNRDVQLNWKTEAEINVDRYNVLRSYDRVNWDEIGQTPSKSVTSADRNDYDYLDQGIWRVTPHTTIYYKIESLDYDGSVSYTEVRAVNKDRGNLAMNIFPNPTADKIYLENFATDEVVSISIFSQLGQLMQQSNNVSLFENNAVDLSELPQGIYRVEVNNGNENIFSSDVIISR